MLLNANGISTIHYNSFGGKMISVTFIAAYDMLCIISRYVVARYPQYLHPSQSFADYCKNDNFKNIYAGWKFTLVMQ